MWQQRTAAGKDVDWKRMWRSVGFRIFVIVFLCAVLQVLAAGWISYAMSRNMMEASIKESASQTIGETADKLELVFKGWDDRAQQLLNDYAFITEARSYFALPDGAPQRESLAISLSERLGSLVNVQKGIMGAYFVPTGDGGEKSAISSKGVIRVPGEEWIKRAAAARGTMVWLETMTDHPNGFGTSKEPVITGAKWVRGADETDGHAFVMVLEIKRSVLQNQVGKLSLSRDGQTALVGADGRIVYASNSKLVGTPFAVDVRPMQAQLAVGELSKGHTAIVKEGGITDSILREIGETVASFAELYPAFQSQLASVAEAESLFSQAQRQMEEVAVSAGAMTAAFGALEEAQAVLQSAMDSVSAVAQQSSATSEEVASLSEGQLDVSRRLVGLSERLESLSGSLAESLGRFKY